MTPVMKLRLWESDRSDIDAVPNCWVTDDGKILEVGKESHFSVVNNRFPHTEIKGWLQEHPEAVSDSNVDPVNRYAMEVKGWIRVSCYRNSVAIQCGRPTKRAAIKTCGMISKVRGLIQEITINEESMSVNDAISTIRGLKEAILPPLPPRSPVAPGEYGKRKDAGLDPKDRKNLEQALDDYNQKADTKVKPFLGRNGRSVVLGTEEDDDPIHDRQDHRRERG